MRVESRYRPIQTNAAPEFILPEGGYFACGKLPWRWHKSHFPWGSWSWWGRRRWNSGIPNKRGAVRRLSILQMRHGEMSQSREDRPLNSANLIDILEGVDERKGLPQEASVTRLTCRPNYTGRMRRRADVAVVGGGILGLAHAYLLARGGRHVILFERNARACGASVRNSGMIWPASQPLVRCATWPCAAGRSGWRDSIDDTGTRIA